ncbi:YqzL family protein [Bacillus hwajinpoensis]|uniref:YqzL family protein n=1 Tax=Guptibacillus hwajinpoensis TaxID=208199 RepID=A0A845EWY5_9BACL|nr:MULTISPECIES: YqzL family protein [Bacillaceae]MCA0992900.1 YqzL family protein [Pseudalkalibacillus hwajinpoensis]MYL63034.1 YqzL family protein [Pseudalkalibacillus hwajinpoensis]QHA92629.1 YqzL family protein [Bacillus sp. N1-1]
MLEFTWKIFCETGNIDTYLLLKEMEIPNDEDNDSLAEMEEVPRLS